MKNDFITLFHGSKVYLIYTNIYNSTLAPCPLTIFNLLVLDLVDQSTNVRQQLDSKLIASLDELLGVLGSTDTGRGASEDDSTSGQSGALGEEADELGDVENQVAISIS